ncbi:MAG: HAMP domain-containing histidine kinase [Helicobacteraceae bacterium]|nr:HAMP domain-containing histidine kinase [Helicobacteraceae bacterium]
MTKLQNINDRELIAELSRRLDEKNASIKETEFLTKKLLALNEKTKESESIKDQFMSLIISSFSNPLKSLLELAASLADKRDRGDFDAAIDKINIELLRLDFDFANIFAAAEIEEGKITSVYSDINFNDIFQRALNALRYQIEEKRLDVVLASCEDSGFTSDERKIYLILINLLSNACEFSYPDSKAIVELKRLEKEFLIAVTDFGEGVNVRYAAQVYCRFARFGGGKTRSRQGLGLGLSVARGFCEALDGKIDFESKEGQTVFRVKLPSVCKKCDINCGEINAKLFDDFKKNAVEL